MLPSLPKNYYSLGGKKMLPNMPFNETRHIFRVGGSHGVNERGHSMACPMSWRCSTHVPKQCGWGCSGARSSCSVFVPCGFAAQLLLTTFPQRSYISKCHSLCRISRWP